MVTRRSSTSWIITAIALVLLSLAGWRLIESRHKAISLEKSSLPVFEQTSFAMGTYVRLQVYGDQAEEAVKASLVELDRLEGVFDRFQANSELGKLNAAAGKGWVSVSPDMLAVLQTALDVAEKSNGAYDPTIAPLVDVWGFREVNGEIPAQAPPAQAQINKAMARVGFRQVKLDMAGRRVALASGAQIDLGGVAKGYALDRLADIVSKTGAKAALLDLGGNIRVVGAKASGTPWRIAVRHPRKTQEIFAVLSVLEKSIATSGDYQRFYEWEGRRYSHIIDPHTGQPAREVISVTVLAPNGALSDALSTAVFVLGEQRGKELLARIPGCEGIFIDQDLHMSVTEGLTGVVERSR